MRMIKNILLIILITIGLRCYSQCTSMPVAPACTGTVLTNGINANTGTTYIYPGGSSTLTIYCNGADIIICSGTLTLSSSSTFNGGRLYILLGATVNTPQTILNTNIFNYGTLNFTSNLTVNSQGLLMNSYNGIININGNLYENTIITNYGTTNITGTLTISNSGSGACLGSNSKLNASTIVYDWNTNPIKVQSGKACVGINTTSISGNTTLSSNTGLTICSPTTLSINGGGTVGSATLTQNCPSCNVALPIELIEFTGKQLKNIINLDWKTASEKNNEFFSILKSYNGIDFNNIGDIYGCGTCDYENSYNYKDYNAKNGINYYKLKQTDNDGDSTVTDVNSVNFDVFFYPNPSSSDRFTVSFKTNKDVQANIKVMNLVGDIIMNLDIDVNETKEFHPSDYVELNSGEYIISVRCEGDIFTNKIIITN